MSFDCHEVEPGFTCPETGGPCIACGDGVRQTGEACDDGNSVGGDGCSADCATVGAWILLSGSRRCLRAMWQRDQREQRAVRRRRSLRWHRDGCELPGNADCGAGELCLGVSGDGCSAACRLELGYQCPVAGRPCERWRQRGRGTQRNLRTTAGAVAAPRRVLAYERYRLHGAHVASRRWRRLQRDLYRIETDYRCPTAAEPCVKCGDGQLDPGEVCDDGVVAVPSPLRRIAPATPIARRYPVSAR